MLQKDQVNQVLLSRVNTGVDQLNHLISQGHLLRAEQVELDIVDRAEQYNDIPNVEQVLELGAF
jgi:hypothetical protein